jgi:glutamate N-acetyltransferase/amino-acid N-acetyltransferase
VSVTAPKGFVAAGGSAGIKAGGAPDLAVVATADGVAVPAAGVFTANKATAAPVQVSRAHLEATGGRAAGVVLSSGNANAATGEPGRQAATELCAQVAAGIGSRVDEVLVCQTGLIGIPFPIEVAGPRVALIVAERAADAAAGERAATAIMTTDTVAKQVTVTAQGFTVGGMAKGAAMLAPNMATMLAVLTTDAAADPADLRELLRQAVVPTFNAMSVDGCTSTNDTVLLLASGAAGAVDLSDLGAAVTEACGSLAEQMVDDAEGATKVIHVTVHGAASDGEAHQAARKVADSLLVKCSVNGEDPYWGRVVSELGTAGVAFDQDLVSVAYGDTVVCRGGVAAPHDAGAAASHMSGRHVEIVCDLGLGSGRGTVLGNDLGYGYIDENRTTS